jgi:hypothetical protein
MRRILVQPLTSDQRWARWQKDCQKATGDLHSAAETGQDLEFNGNLYKRLKTELFGKDSPFYGKCVYCECYIGDFQHGDVEHFRPKAAVTDEVDQPVLGHPGYYWLAYDWQNLLPACEICNQPSKIGDRKIGKHCRFPVIGQHAYCEAEIEAERPLLINPASTNPNDDPSKHLRVDPDTGLMIGLTDRGKMCIEIFGLNVRDRLVEKRRKACREIPALFQDLQRPPDDRECQETLAELHNIKMGKREYSMSQNAMLKRILENSDSLRSKD